LFFVELGAATIVASTVVSFDSLKPFDSRCPPIALEDRLAENVKLRQPAKVGHRRLVRHRPAAGQAGETPGGRHVVQDVPGRAVAQFEEQLEAAPPENCLQRERGRPRRPFGQ